MSDRGLELCVSVRHVRGGYIVELRAPFGATVGHGEVVCETLDEVFELLARADIDPVRKATP